MVQNNSALRDWIRLTIVAVVTLAGAMGAFFTVRSMAEQNKLNIKHNERTIEDNRGDIEQNEALYRAIQKELNGVSRDQAVILEKLVSIEKKLDNE